MNQPGFKSKSTRTIIIVFAVFVLAVICAGYLFYKSQEKRIVSDKKNELAAIASLKAGEIAKWRKERVSDCEVIRNNPVLVRHISAFFEKEEPQTREELIAWMESLVKNFDYKNILLIDSFLNVRLSYPLSDTMYGDSLESKMPEVFEKGEIIFTSLHASEQIRDAHLDILVPLVDDMNSIFGIAALRIDPDINLFPLIQHWPTPSKSSETILLRREGDSVTCLNRLRHNENAVLNLKFPVSDKGIPEYVFGPEPEIAFHFIDYRNTEVISIMRKIPDSPWYIIAKVDRKEIYSPLQAEIFSIILTAALMILAAIAVTGYFWRNQILRFYRMQLESEIARTRAEDAYHQLLVRSEAILASVPNIIMEVDTNRVYKWANKPGYEFFGTDVIGKEASYYFAGENQDTYQIVDPLFSGENEKVYVESWQRRRDGEKRLLAWWCRTLKDDDRKVTGVLSSAFDITEQYRAKEELKQSEERLKQINATKDKFFSIISHDLRSPFASIIGLSELLNEQVANKNYSRIEKYAAIIRNSSYYAMNLLRNLTEWSQVQTGRIEFHPADYNLNSIVDEVTELLSESALQKSIKIYNDIPEDMVVFADKHMLSAILRNLISNAVKFTLCEGKIRISASNRESASFVSVTDNGIGIEQDRIAKLFNPDTNISTRGTRKEEGTGLGLILCREFVQRHGGEIQVESVPGQGSTFTFSLPGKRVPEEAKKSREVHLDTR